MKRHSRRAGFTLIELLVVIAILAILFSMTSAAIFKVMERADEVKARVEMSQLAQGIQAFMSRFGLTHPPPANFDPTGGDPESMSFLYRCWPNINRGSLTAAGWPRGMLTGEEALVFLLGGMVQDGKCVGFSTDPRNPAQYGGDRIGPFFDFGPDRLQMTGQNRYVYWDSFQTRTPYVYFSAKRTPGGDPYYNLSSTGAQPYRASPGGPYWKEDSFQILCAGADGKFGGRDYWRADAAAQIYPRNHPGYDDLANFYDKRLGISSGY